MENKQAYSIEQISAGLFGGTSFLETSNAIFKHSEKIDALSKQIACFDDDSFEGKRQLGKLNIDMSMLRAIDNDLCAKLISIEKETLAKRHSIINEIRGRPDSELLGLCILQTQIKSLLEMRLLIARDGTECSLFLFQYSIARIQEFALYISTPLFDSLAAMFKNPLSNDAMELLRVAMESRAKRQAELEIESAKKAISIVGAAGNASVQKPEPPSTVRYTRPMTMKELKDIFKMEERSISRWLKDGELKAKKKGGRWQIASEEMPDGWDSSLDDKSDVLSVKSRQYQPKAAKTRQG